MPATGPTLLGFDVLWIATILSGVATMMTSTPMIVGPLAGAIGLRFLRQISKLIMRDMMKAPMLIQIRPPPPAIIRRWSTKKPCM